MTRHFIFRILAALVLLTAIAGIAYFAYTAGMATNVQQPVAQGETHSYPTYGYGWHPFHFFGFGCFGPLVVLFLLCMAFCAMRRMIWGPRWGGHHMHRHGPWSEKDSDKFVPPMFGEWHRRAHASPPEDKQPGDDKAQK